MSMVTYPLNNIEYTAEDAELFHSTRTSGVYATNSFDYSVTGADNTIIIRTGIAWIKNSEFSGKVVAQKESISLDMGLPDSVYPRIDAIVIQFDANKNASEILVKEGVASSNPTPPNVVRTESIYELHLYHVRRYAGSLTISPDSISDLRTNSNYCGLMYDSVTQAVDATLSKSGIAADAEAVGKRISNLKAKDVGAAPSGLHRCYGSLKDIGITTFPTTMSTIASKMPNNSTLILDSRDIVSGGTNEISDLGATGAGMYMIMRGNTNSRVQLLHIYDSAGATTSYIEVGNYSKDNDTVSWVRAVKTSGDTMTGSLQIDGSWKGVSFGENAAILNAGTRITFDQRPQNSTGSFERYVLPTPTERTGDVWYNILTTKDSKDYVTAQGTSGNWHYRKYNSGYCECWRSITEQVTTSQWEAWGGIYLTQGISVGAFPFTIYSAVPNVTAHNAGNNTLGVVTASDVSATTMNEVRCFRGTKPSSTITVVYNIFVCGKWKE